MNVIKRKINLEESTNRTSLGKWGDMTATTFYINVMLTQTIDDMGLFTDIEHIPLSNDILSQPNYTSLVNKLNLNGYTFPFMTSSLPLANMNLTNTDNFTLRLPNKTRRDYYKNNSIVITGMTDSKINDLKSYNAINTYINGFDISKENYVNYKGLNISGHNRVVSNVNPLVYVIDAIVGVTMGSNTQVHGLQYRDNTGTTRNVILDGIQSSIPVTEMRYIGEGWNRTNIVLSAQTKEEYLFGITSKPFVESDVFIERGITTVMDKHLRLSEIRNIDELSRYGNKLYNIIK